MEALYNGWKLLLLGHTREVSVSVSLIEAPLRDTKWLARNSTTPSDSPNIPHNIQTIEHAIFHTAYKSEL